MHFSSPHNGPFPFPHLCRHRPPARDDLPHGHDVRGPPCEAPRGGRARERGFFPGQFVLCDTTLPSVGAAVPKERARFFPSKFISFVLQAFLYACAREELRSPVHLVTDN